MIDLQLVDGLIIAQTDKEHVGKIYCHSSFNQASEYKSCRLDCLHELIIGIFVHKGLDAISKLFKGVRQDLFFVSTCFKVSSMKQVCKISHLSTIIFAHESCSYQVVKGWSKYAFLRICIPFDDWIVIRSNEFCIFFYMLDKLMALS